MADFTRTEQSGRSHLYSWNLTTADATGEAVEGCGAADKTVQMVGTWGSATCVLEGSLDGTNYFTLTDPQGNAISKTDDAGEAVFENPLHVRPRLSVGGSGADINVYLLARSTTR